MQPPMMRVVAVGSVGLHDQVLIDDVKSLAGEVEDDEADRRK
jgi:hypothetical protein